MTQRYLSAHIFYNVIDARLLLVECVTPLISTLENEALIDGYFFIRYWLGGPHIRLRLRLMDGAEELTVKEILEKAVRSYLARRPSLFDLDPVKSQPYMRRLYEAEYGSEAFKEQFGENASVPIYPNNSISYIDYQPEYDRYGGPKGVELAEWHFERSSATVLRILKTGNCHIKSALLGQGLQLMHAMASVCYPDPSNRAVFFERYSQAWREQYLQDNVAPESVYEKAYDRQRSKLERHIAGLEVYDTAQTHQSNTVYQWYEHCMAVKDAVLALYESGELVLSPLATSPEEAMRRVFVSYMHMTNNRLGISIPDESYLAHILGRTIQEMCEA